MSRRRRQQRLERVLGTPALFSTAYGNVGSSIYYALGVTAVFALGLTPIVFVIAGIIFAATAATYAEGTVRFPEAGGSSSFARHAFNELVSFGAAWAQMLNYIITIAISAFFVPHYLSIFWAPLKQNPWDIVVGALVIAVLVTLNIVGTRESARVNIGLALIDFATQILLVLLGFALIFSPHVLSSNIHLGVAPTWSQFFIAIPVAMIAYTGIETVSNLAEEARDPVKNIPRAISFVAIAVFAIYFTLPWIALSALPVTLTPDGHYKTLLGVGPPHGFSNDPVLGLVENMGVHGVALSAMKVYVGILAATILFIAANAGVIGASRITYAMASYRQLPEVFRRLHGRFKTPYISLFFFAGVIPVLVLLPGKTKFLGTMYSFGAMLSFTVAHAAVVALRYKRRDEELIFRARPNLRWRGVDWPLFAVFGGLGTGLSWLVVVVQASLTRWVGLGWLVAGFVGLRGLSPAAGAAADRDAARADPDRPRGGARVPQRARPDRAPAGVGGGGRPGLPSRDRAGGHDRRGDGARGAAGAAARRAAARRDGAPGPRPARRGARDRRRLRGGRGRAAHPRTARRTRDRRRGRAAQQRDHRDGRSAPRRAAPERADLRRHRGLRAQARAVPRDGGRGAEGRMTPYRSLVTIFGVIAIGLGVALVVQTARVGGGTGYLIGVLFVALGAGRLYLLHRRR